MRIPPKMPLVCLALLAVLALLAACNATPTPPPSAEEVLERSAKAMRGLESTHFILERTGAPAYVDPTNTFVLKRMEGDVKTPDGARAKVRVIAPMLVADVSLVILGDDWYETNPLTGEWGRYAGMGYNPAMFFDPEHGLAALMTGHLTELKLAGTEELEDLPGDTLIHLTAQAPGEPVSAMTNGLMGRGPVYLDLWIHPETYFVWRLQAIEPATDPEDPTVWVLDFDDFNEALTIKAPIP